MFDAYAKHFIKRDGRVLLTEHVYTYMTLAAIPGLLAARGMLSVWPFIIALIFGLIIGVISWRADVKKHDDDFGPIRDPNAKLPWSVRIYGPLMIIGSVYVIYTFVHKGLY